MDTVTVENLYVGDASDIEVARLPDDSLDQPGSDNSQDHHSGRGDEGLVADQRLASHKTSKNNVPLYAGVGLAALLMAGGYFVLRPHVLLKRVQATQARIVHQGGAQISGIMPLAPAATLANVRLPPTASTVVHRQYIPQPLATQLTEIDQLRSGTPPVVSVAASTAPPAAGTGMPTEPKLAPPDRARTSRAPTATAFHPMNAVVAPIPSASPLNMVPRTSHDKKLGAQVPILAEPGIAGAGPVQVAFAKVATSAAAPKVLVPASAPTLAAAQTGALSPAQQTSLFQMLTEIATMERDDRIRNAVLTGEVQQLSALVTIKFADFDRRLSIEEAQNAVSGAMQAGSNSAVLAAIAAPPAVVTAASAALTKYPPKSGGEVTPAAVAPAAPVQGSPAVSFQYHVQAASPGLAMLSVVGGDAAPLEVVVGDIVPGYGRVTGVVQQGDSWVVETQSGNIE